MLWVTVVWENGAENSGISALMCMTKVVKNDTHRVASHCSWHKCFNTLRTGDADLRLYITTVQDGWCKSAFLTRTWFSCTIHLITKYMEPVSEWSCWRMFIETWPHSELMICDKYREQRTFCFPLLLCSTFSQRSDFNHDGKRKNVLQMMKFQRNCWRTHYLMFLTRVMVTVTLLLLEIGKTKLCILYWVTVTVKKVQTKVTMTMKH